LKVTSTHKKSPTTNNPPTYNNYGSLSQYKAISVLGHFSPNHRSD